MSAPTVVRVCMGPAGISAGGKDVLEAFVATLAKRGVAAEVKERCSSHQVGCMGLCARDVLVEVHAHGGKSVYQYVKPEMVARIVGEHIIAGAPVREWLVDETYDSFFKKQVKIVLSDCGVLDPECIDDYIAAGGYAPAREVLTTMVPDEVINDIKASGIRGRGGAGFPTGLKWELARQSKGDVKYIICNADEGDPGAFMDRAVIEGNPHSVIEGMIIGAFAIGAHKGYVYLRAEYPLAVERLTLALGQARERHFLGKDILGAGFDFDIEIKLGAGAFVCGEETALIASIEGQRGMPRPKPPFPIAKGLWQRPTVINNVETLANIPYIMRKGAAWYASFGTEKSKGTKVFALTGKIKNPGLIEVPMGITLREIIEEIGGGIDRGRRLKAVQTGGPSGGCIPANLLDMSVDYESLAKVGSIVGSGGMIVLDENDCMVNVAKYFVHFTQAESCGKCIPCRIGTKRLHEMLERITEGLGAAGDLERLETLSHGVRMASLCGLGQSAPNPVLSTLKYFRDEYEAHVKYKRCPSMACKEIVSSPCQHTCPIGTEASVYTALIALGRHEEAFQVIRKDNPLASICGRVCHHPCESTCKAGDDGNPIAIRALKRFVTDYAAKGKIGVSQQRGKPKTQRVAIIGSGPAGLTAGYFLALQGYQVTILEAKSVVGGMLRVAIPTYRLPRKLLEADLEIIKSAGVQFRTNAVLGKDITLEGLFAEGYAAVFLAIGAHRSKKFGVPGENTEGVIPSLQFLEAVNLDQAVKVGSRIAVVGGGNSAVDAARAAMRLPGVEKVTLLYRRTLEEMPAFEEEVEAAREEGVDLQLLSAPVEVLSRKGKLQGVQCVRMTLGAKDASGRAAPVPLPGSEFTVEAETVIVAIGEDPDMAWHSGAAGLGVSARKTLVVDPMTMATSRQGVFAGGDLVTGSNTVIHAMQAGKRAAVAIDKYLRGESLEMRHAVTRPSRYVEPLDEAAGETPETGRREIPVRAVAERNKNFKEVETGFDEMTAIQEARRCLRCEFGTKDGQEAFRKMKKATKKPVSFAEARK